MSADWGVGKFPTFIFFKSGKEVDRVVGTSDIHLHVTHASNLDHDVRELNMNSSVSCSCLLSSYFNSLFIYIYIAVTSLLMFGDIFLCSVFCALCYLLRCLSLKIENKNTDNIA
jgi:hypothetical protein